MYDIERLTKTTNQTEVWEMYKNVIVPAQKQWAKAPGLPVRVFYGTGQQNYTFFDFGEKGKGAKSYKSVGCEDGQSLNARCEGM